MSVPAGKFRSYTEHAHAVHHVQAEGMNVVTPRPMNPRRSAGVKLVDHH
jgi:hypothetical protein